MTETAAPSGSLVRVIIKGGILSPGDMMRIVEVAQSLGSHYIHLGSRQDILFPIALPVSAEKLTRLDELPLPYEYRGEQHQNIISSYVTLDLMPSTRWLAPHIYHYVLDSFNYHPTHKINIVDPLQGMVPLFTGNINFIASSIDNYWYLYLRYSELSKKPWMCPALIYGFDLAKVAKGIEAINPVQTCRSLPEVYQRLRQAVSFTTHPAEDLLRYPEMLFPYYEGINRIEGDRYWIGVYWRNNQFTGKFLAALCQLCLETNLGTISLTPWKSVVIRDVREKHLLAWEKLLGNYGINMRHSSLELNWHLPVANPDALELKNYLVRALDQQDISTYGLTFAIKTQAHKIPFASIIIEQTEVIDAKAPPLYNIAYARNFNPNLLDYLYYTKGVTQEIIPPLLIELSKQYYEQLTVERFTPPIDELHRESRAAQRVYQCSECLSIYDPALGDEAAQIVANTPFEALPSRYQCSVCGGEKSNFIEQQWPVDSSL